LSNLQVVISKSSISTLRLKQLWSIVTNTKGDTLLSLNNKDLSEFLLNKLDLRDPLTSQENQIVNTYIHSKISLIRDLAN